MRLTRYSDEQRIKLPFVDERPAHPVPQQPGAEFSLSPIQNPYQRPPSSIVGLITIDFEVSEGISSKEHVRPGHELAEKFGF